MKRVLLADDHAIVRKGLKETLEEELGDVEFGEAEDGRQVLELVWKRNWDLLILDLSMGGRGGLEVLEDVRKARPGLPVLVLSMYPAEEFGVRALKAGACGFVNKRSAPDELVTAVKAALDGRRYISEELANRMATDLQRGGGAAPHEALSAREYQVMTAIARGKSLKEIAAELSISAKTVGTYHTRLLAKLGLKSDVEVTRYAILNKLVD